jgi:voltage-gated potassium channel
VSWTDFLLLPLPVLFAGLPLFVHGPPWLTIALLVLAGCWVLGTAVVSMDALDVRQWVGGARIQLPIMLSCLFLGEVVWFSSLYWLISRANVTAFNQSLDRVGALYFSLTTITTTGFGDINAISQGARIAVSAEMVCSVLTIVVVIATAASKAFTEGERPQVTILDDKKTEK